MAMVRIRQISIVGIPMLALGALYLAVSSQPETKAVAQQEKEAEVPAKPQIKATADLPIAAFRQQIDLLDQAEGTAEQTGELVATWWDANAESSLTPDDLSWILDHLHQADQALDDKSFSVKWTGSIKVPITGEYTFSISPLNVNYTEHSSTSIRQAMSVSVDGQEILNATPEKWVGQAAPVALTAGESVPIEVKFFNERAEENTAADPAIATLSWEGPALEKSLVSSAVLSPPEGAGQGLLAEYRSEVNGVTQTRSQIEKTVDRYWFQHGSVVPKFSSQQDAAAKRLWSAVTDSSFNESWSKASAEGQHASHFATAVSFLGSPERAAAAQELLQRRELLQAFTARDTKELYNVLRVGAPGTALDIFGSWAQLHANLKPRIARDFDEANRRDFRELMTSILWQDRQQFDMLQENYLLTETGECCLPVAYTLAFGYLKLDRRDEWIELLDSRLHDESLKSDQRVNWLFARAMIAEYRGNAPAVHITRRSYVSRPSMNRGQGWIDEARLVAESEATLYHANWESIARQASTADLDKAESKLTQLESTLTDPQLKLDAKMRHQEIAQLRAHDAERLRQSREHAGQAYLRVIKRRLGRAQDRGDTTKADRYEAIIARSEG